MIAAQYQAPGLRPDKCLQVYPVTSRLERDELYKHCVLVSIGGLRWRRICQKDTLGGLECGVSADLLTAPDQQEAFNKG